MGHPKNQNLTWATRPPEKSKSNLGHPPVGQHVAVRVVAGPAGHLVVVIISRLEREGSVLRYISKRVIAVGVRESRAAIRASDPRQIVGRLILSVVRVNMG